MLSNPVRVLTLSKVFDCRFGQLGDVDEFNIMFDPPGAQEVGESACLSAYSTDTELPCIQSTWVAHVARVQEPIFKIVKKQRPEKDPARH